MNFNLDAMTLFPLDMNCAIFKVENNFNLYLKYQSVCKKMLKFESGFHTSYLFSMYTAKKNNSSSVRDVM